MIITLCIGCFIELALCIYLLKVVHKHEWDIYNRELKIEVLQHDIDTYNESMKVLSDSVRKLNGVVKDLEQKQPKIEPKNRMNTRAFIAGWDADEPEPEDPAKKHIVDICLNGTPKQKQDLIDAMTLQSIFSSQSQQCIYPWQQTPSGAILPLWYINRRLEDM